MSFHFDIDGRNWEVGFWWTDDRIGFELLWFMFLFVFEDEEEKIVVDYEKLPHRGYDNAHKYVDFLDDFGYVILKVDYHTGMIRAEKDKVQVNFYTTTKTITTEMHHPKKGKTQLHRKKCNWGEIEKILQNPREHTGKGYYEKH